MSKWAIITGGSRGIGRAICLKLAAESSYKLLITYHSNVDAARETLEEVKSLGAEAEIIQFDVADRAGTHAALTSWQAAHPDDKMEVIINNAGVTRDGLFMWMGAEDWDKVINTSLNGFYHVTNFFIQNLLRNKYGRIVNISSVSGNKGTAGQVNYSAAKGALVAATKALAQEVAKRNITVNAVAPGFIRSDMTGELNEEELKKMIPVGRFGEAEEVAELVNFLVSKKASYITGEVININGGIYS